MPTQENRKLYVENRNFFVCVLEIWIIGNINPKNEQLLEENNASRRRHHATRFTFKPCECQ